MGDKVSIIMNCYNGEEYLREAINSVIAQTYENWELIFWDNRSTDNTAQIFQEFKDIRFRYFLAPSHTLLYEARSMAMQKVSGEYIAFLDVDDWWEPEKIAQQIPFFKNKDVAVVYGNYWLKNERKKQDIVIANKRKLPEGLVLDALLKDYVVGILTIMIRRSAIESLDKCFDTHYQIIGDYDLIIRLAAEYKFACVQKPIAFYRWHGKNTSFVQSDRELAEIEHWIKNISHDKRISSNLNLIYVKNRLIFQKVLNALKCGKRKHALHLFINHPWGLMKLKLFAVLIVPYAIIDKLRA
jgi:glycosyltransferase involved in cell wall biosynthesis